MAAHQAPLSLGFSRQEYWSELPFPSPMYESEKGNEVAQSCPTLSNPMDCSLPGSSAHGIFQARVLEWGAIAFSRMILIAGKSATLSWETEEERKRLSAWVPLLPLFKQDGPYFHFAPGPTNYVLNTYSMPGTALDVSCINDLILFSCKVKVKSLSRVRLFSTSWTVAYQAPPPVHGIFQARILEWAAISFYRGSSQPRNQTWVSCIADRRFTVWPTR